MPAHSTRMREFLGLVLSLLVPLMAGDAVSTYKRRPEGVCEGVERVWAVCRLGGSTGLWRAGQGQNRWGKDHGVVNRT